MSATGRTGGLRRRTRGVVSILTLAVAAALLPVLAAPAGAQVAAAVDLRLVVSGPEELAAGSSTTMAVDVANAGGVAATGASTLTFDLNTYERNDAPIGTPVGTGWTCVRYTGPDSWEPDMTCTHPGPVAAGASLPRLVFPVTATAAAYPYLRGHASVTHPSEPVDTTFDNDGYVQALITNVANLTIRGETDESPLEVGRAYDLRATITNIGSAAATGTTTVSTAMPDGLELVSASGTGWTCSIDPDPPADDPGLTCTHPGPFAPDAESVIHLQIEVGAAAAPQARVELTLQRGGDPSTSPELEDSDNNVARVYLEVIGVPDLAVTGYQLSAPGLVAGEDTSVAVTVSNIGSTDTSGPVAFTHQITAGVTVLSATGTGWVCTNGSTLSCTHTGTLAASTALPVLTLGLRTPGTSAGLVATTTVNASAPDDSSPGTQQFPTTVKTGFDLRPTTATVGQPQRGGTWTYTITAANAGVVAKPGAVRVTDDLGAGLTPASASGSGWTCSSSGQRFTCDRTGGAAANETLPAISVVANVGAAAVNPLQHTATVSHSADTNTANNTIIGQASLATAPNLTVDVTDSNATFEVGETGTYQATVRNAGDGPTTGTVTTTGETPSGTTITGATGSGWTCSTPTNRSFSCTRTAAIAANSTAPAISVTVVPLAAAGSQTRLTVTVSGGGQTTTTDDSDTETTPVTNTTLAAVIDTDRTTGDAPVKISFDGRASSGPITTYAWDFGDGGKATGAVVDHTYTFPGTYQATLTVSSAASTASATVRIIVTAPHTAEPLHADAGSDQVVTEDDTVLLDGSASTPAHEIDGYRWDFGDGETAEGANADHEFAEPGTYEVELTITRGSDTDTDTTIIEVQPADDSLVVEVLAQGAPVDQAMVLVTDPDGTRHPAVTGVDGTASIAGLGDGDHTVLAYQSGYVPASVPTTTDGGAGHVTINLEPGDVGSSLIATEELTLEEIEDLGIDTSDPANQHVTQYTVSLTINGTTASVPVPVNDDDEVVGPQAEECPPDHSCPPAHWGGGVAVVGDYEPEGAGGRGPSIVWLVSAKSAFLKEFFEVSLTVTNLAPDPFTFTEGSATLSLPAGLSLAPTARPQRATAPLDDIAGGGSAGTTWIVRGDVAGDHHVSVAYNGILDPVGAGINLQAQTFTPIHVVGGDAVKFIVDAETTAYRNLPYRFRVGLQNTSTTSIHAASVEVNARIDGTVRQPCGDPGPFSAASIAPGQILWSSDYARISTLDGSINLEESFVKKVVGETSTDPELRTHAPLHTPQTAPKASAVATGAQVRVTWDAIDGATSYSVWTLSERDADFGPEPAAIVTGTTATIALPDGPSPWVAICAGGNLYHPLTPITGDQLRVVGFSTPKDDVTWELDGSESENATNFQWKITPPGVNPIQNLTGETTSVTVDRRGHWTVQLTACATDAPTVCKTARADFDVITEPDFTAMLKPDRRTLHLDAGPTKGPGSSYTWFVGTKQVASGKVVDWTPDTTDDIDLRLEVGDPVAPPLSITKHVTFDHDLYLDVVPDDDGKLVDLKILTPRSATCTATVEVTNQSNVWATLDVSRNTTGLVTDPIGASLATFELNGTRFLAPGGYLASRWQLCFDGPEQTVSYKADIAAPAALGMEFLDLMLQMFTGVSIAGTLNDIELLWKIRPLLPPDFIPAILRCGGVTPCLALVTIDSMTRNPRNWAAIGTEVNKIYVVKEVRAFWDALVKLKDDGEVMIQVARALWEKSTDNGSKALETIEKFLDALAKSTETDARNVDKLIRAHDAERARLQDALVKARAQRTSWQAQVKQLESTLRNCNVLRCSSATRINLYQQLTRARAAYNAVNQGVVRMTTRITVIGQTISQLVRKGDAIRARVVKLSTVLRNVRTLTKAIGAFSKVVQLWNLYAEYEDRITGANQAGATTGIATVVSCTPGGSDARCGAPPN